MSCSNVVRQSQMFCSTRQDDLVVIHVQNEFGSLIETKFKTEFLTTLSKRYKEKIGRDLRIDFNDL